MQRNIIGAGFELLQKDIDDMEIIDLPFRLGSWSL